jgi:hypothetical protein
MIRSAASPPKARSSPAVSHQGERRPDHTRARGRAKLPRHADRRAGRPFRDNLVLDYAGVRGNQLSPAQRTALLDLISEYVRNMANGHARVRMDEVRAHVNDTWFAWIGSTAPDAVFYYRIHSPVILIEFDHQTPVALPGERVPAVRTSTRRCAHPMATITARICCANIMSSRPGTRSTATLSAPGDRGATPDACL